MLGYAEFKSHVLKRDEKGLFGIPFKRLLGCGLGAGALLTVLRLALPDVAFVSAALSFVVLLVLTAPRGGIARWQQLLYALRWWLLTASALTPKSMAGQLARALGVPGESIDIDADALFRVEDDAPHTDLSDWVSFSKPLLQSNALSFETTPGLALSGETP